MLEGLDTVPWEQLGHAYGPATDVPGMIRELTSDDAKIRKEARSQLHSTICHQGTVYPATAYAVPFLIELAQDQSIAERDQILRLLVHLASGNSYLDVHQYLDLYKELMIDTMAPGEFEQQLRASAEIT